MGHAAMGFSPKSHTLPPYTLSFMCRVDAEPLAIPPCTSGGGLRLPAHASRHSLRLLRPLLRFWATRHLGAQAAQGPAQQRHPRTLQGAPHALQCHARGTRLPARQLAPTHHDSWCRARLIALDSETHVAQPHSRAMTTHTCVLRPASASV